MTLVLEDSSHKKEGSTPQNRGRCWVLANQLHFFGPNEYIIQVEQSESFRMDFGFGRILLDVPNQNKCLIFPRNQDRMLQVTGKIKKDFYTTESDKLCQ